MVVHVGAEKRGSCDNETGCKPGSAGGFSPLNLDGRWGHRFSEHVGLMGGVTFPGFRNSKTSKVDAALVSYGVLTLETPIVSVGLGPELGTRVAGGSVGLDLQPLGNELSLPHLLGLSPYFRYLTPYRIHEADENGQVPSWDTGVRLRVGPAVLGYTFYRQTQGVIDYVIYESSVRAQSWHMLTFGVELNRDSLDFGGSFHRELETPRCQGAECFAPHGVPHRSVWRGCAALCGAQAELSCGLSESECESACEKRTVAEECWAADDALLTCQARGVACKGDRVWFPSCTPEQDAFDRCVVRATLAR